MLGEIQHVLGDLHVLDVVEIFLLAAHLVGVAQQRAHQALVERLQRDDVLAVGQHHAADRDLVHAADGFADHREGVVADLAVRHEIIGADHIAAVDIGPRHELVDLDGAGRFQRDVVKLVLRHLDVGVGVDLVALHDVFVGDFLAGVGIDLGIFDAMAGLAVDLVEARPSRYPTSPDTGRPGRSRAKGAESPSSWRGGPWDTPKNATDDRQGYHRMPPSQTWRDGESAERR